ncbi:PaaI family thioesterase [Geothermobacter ehrlichii]|uniref:PaaI family thioesterase n=1 Tax=Geothermobacter ehrlichii TaxID=213224 RepID=UPI0011E85D2D|nr:PaaI family thioesterase [Geothermobacter ehrlichii]
MDKRELLNSLVDDGFLAYMGFRLVEWDIDYAVMEFTVGPQHLNRHQIIHGGVLTSIIDSVAGFAGLYGPGGQLRKGVTLSVTTSFTGKASSGTIRAVGRKKTAGKTTFVSTVEVIAEDGKRIALGQATYLYLKD